MRPLRGTRPARRMPTVHRALPAPFLTRNDRCAAHPGTGPARSTCRAGPPPRAQPTGTAVAFCRSMEPDQTRRGGRPTNFPKSSAAAVAASTPGTIS